MMEKIIESNKEQDTYDLGYELGQHAKPGQVFTLVGDLGVGKTVFTKGLAAGTWHYRAGQQPDIYNCAGV